jgi:hypothetical protein
LKYWPSKRTTKFAALKPNSPKVEPTSTYVHSQMRAPIAYRKMTRQDRREHELRNTGLAAAGGYYTGGKIWRSGMEWAPNTKTFNALRRDTPGPERLSTKTRRALYNDRNIPLHLDKKPKVYDFLDFQRRYYRNVAREAKPGQNLRHMLRRTPANISGRVAPLVAGAAAGTAALAATRRKDNRDRYVTTYQDKRYRTAKRT